MKYIIAYNLEWPGRFEQIIMYVKKFVPDTCAFHHVGSTSVPNMPAKDVIDLDIEYMHGCLAKVIDGLKAAGYAHEGDLGIAGRQVFTPISNSRAASLPVHHLYACESGAYELAKHLAYRDYLMANSDRAKWLATQKIAVDASAKSKEEYIDKKSGFYEIITHESMSWVDNCVRRTRKRC